MVHGSRGSRGSRYIRYTRYMGRVNYVTSHHKGAIPHAQRTHRAGHVRELVVQVGNHRMVDPSVVVGDRGEAPLILNWRLQRGGRAQEDHAAWRS